MAVLTSSRKNSEGICNSIFSYALILAFCFIGSLDISRGTHLPTVDFSYTAFNPGEGIETVGNATIENKALNLTTGGLPHSIGRALRSKAVKIWDPSTGLTLSFSTSFTFSVEVGNPEAYGDGFAFGLFPSKAIPDNSGGATLGLYDYKSQERNYVVAVEFDLFRNVFDPDSNHVGIDLNNITSACTSLLTNFGVRLKAGNNINVRIDYDGFTGRFSVYAINSSLGNPLGNLVLSCNCNVSKYILDGEVFVGFSAATGDHGEYHTIHSWSFKTSEGRSSHGRRNKILGVILGVLVFGAGFVVAVVCYRRRCMRKGMMVFRPAGHDERSNPRSDLSKEIIQACVWDVFPRKFSYEELSCATNDFDPKELLGEGGFGGVYKGMICCENSCRPIAVKRFSQGSNQSDREYLAEVAIIGRLRHRNLVQLQGWCHDRGELLLVYDYMPNGSVDQLLYDAKSGSTDYLDWPKRLKICRGLAAALLYLHEECQHKVVHRDVKTSNVMVDADYDARLGDFGLARFVENYYSNAASHTMTGTGGTVGYIAPERFLTGKATLESDVFSYGAVLLEIACGRRPVDPNARAEDESVLVDWVWKLITQNRLLDAVDPKLGGMFNAEEMERVLTLGLLCSSPDPRRRPTIRQALRILDYEAPLPPLPVEKPMALQCCHGTAGFGMWNNVAPQSPLNNDRSGEGASRSIEGDLASTTDLSVKSHSSGQSTAEIFF